MKKIVIASDSFKGSLSSQEVADAFEKGVRDIIEECNIVKKHNKGNAQQAGGILEVEAPIHASNVMIVDPKTKKPTRIGHTIDKNNKKIRIAKKSGEKID